MTYKKNTAEGGTNGTSASTSNTGGTSGDAASAFPGSTAPIFSSSSPLSGSLSYDFSAASGSSCIWQWTGTSGIEKHLEFDYAFDANPSSTTEIVHIRTSSVAQVRLLLTSGGKLQVNHQVSGSSAALSPNFASALTPNTAYVIRIRVKTGATGVGDGQIEVAYALKSSPTTYIEHINISTGNTGTVAFTDDRLGKLTTTTWTGHQKFDSIQVSDVTTGTFLGEITSTPPTPAVVQGDYYIVDLTTSTPGASGTLSFSTTHISGQTLTVAQSGGVFEFTKSAVGTGTYRFTVTEAPSGATATIDVTIPQSPGSTLVNKTAPAVPNHSAPSNVWT